MAFLFFYAIKTTYYLHYLEFLKQPANSDILDIFWNF